MNVWSSHARTSPSKRLFYYVIIKCGVWNEYGMFLNTSYLRNCDLPPTLLQKAPILFSQTFAHKGPLSQPTTIQTAESQHGTIVSALCTHSHISSLLPKRGANTAEDEDILFSLFSTFPYSVVSCSSQLPQKILLALASLQ